MQVHLPNGQMSFVYRGHWVKVTGAKNATRPLTDMGSTTTVVTASPF